MANRKNAKKGGVKTEEGKAVVRLNALKHGLLCQEVLLSGEDWESLSGLEGRLLAELQPQGEIERILVDRIVSSVWRLKRTVKIERAHMEYAHEHRLRESVFGPEGLQKTRLASVEMLDGDSTERIMRYETAIERQIYKALHELIRLQMARQGQKPLAPIAIDVEVSQAD